MSDCNQLIVLWTCHTKPLSKISSPIGTLIESSAKFSVCPLYSKINVCVCLCVFKLTKLSRPPPRRSTAPICMEETWGTLTGGPRSRFSRSPSRSPWLGITCGWSMAAAGPPLTGLSPVSMLSQEKTVVLLRDRYFKKVHYHQKCAETKNFLYSK